MNFIEKHGLWNDDQKKRAAEIKQQLQKGDIKLVRLAWADPHGYSRAKMVTSHVLISALVSGYNINVATSTLDSANARTFSSFTRGGGMGLEEMTGSPNLTIVPDPLSFRVLPWAPGVAWIICDEYFNNGVPFHFSPRQQLKRQIAKLEAEGRRMMVGLEIEWYLLKVAQDQLTDDNIGLPGVRGKPIATCAVEPGYSYHSESNLDIMQPVLSALAEAYEAIGLPLRSLENEWGPGQVECTFAPSRALAAADNALLFRTATRQICRRMGYFATFMCRPGLKGYYSSGWHLHQSLVDIKTGANLFTPEKEGQHLSPLGRAYLAGLLNHAVPATAFACPTVNGYRRYKPNSLAPDRATWAYDHRGAMLRVLGGPNDPASRIENRCGEPSANPYLYIASQIIAGRAGIAGQLDPGASDDEPYAAERTALPVTLIDALNELEKEPLFREEMGNVFIDYLVKLKRNEANRYLATIPPGGSPTPETSEWEQNEYFDFY
jgi:glutamine synthetase